MHPLPWPDPIHPGEVIVHTLAVPSPPDEEPLELSVMVTRGAHDGPTLLVFAGVHGDEYEGVRAIPELMQRAAAIIEHGRLIAVPVCNPPAFAAATRNSPVDGLNLARVFPGDAQGTLSQRIAHTLTTQLIARSDFLIDFHSAGIVSSMPLLVGYSAADTPLGRRSAAAAAAFSAEVIWGHPHDPTAVGRTISAAEELGVPWLYTEAAGGGRTLPEQVECFITGALRVMHHLGMASTAPHAEPPRIHLLGAGNTDASIQAQVAGYFIPTVKLLDRVEAGQILGAIYTVTGMLLEQLVAPVAGRMVLVRGLPRVHAGEGLFLISGEQPVTA